MRITPDENVALIADRILVNIGSIYIGVAILHFTLVLTNHFKDIKDSSIYVGIYTIPIFISTIRAATPAIVVGVKLEYWGYTEIPSGLGAIAYGILVVTFFLITFYLLIINLKNVEGKTKTAYKLLIAGLIIPVAIGFMTDTLLPNIGIHIPEMAMTATIVFAITLIIVIKNLEVFEIIPVKELGKDRTGHISEKKPFDLLPGKIYYLDEQKAEVSLKAFMSLIHSGRPGLAFIRMSPKNFREVTGIEKTPIIWLASQEVADENVINPSAIPRISAMIMQFLTSAKEPVIYLEGLESLIFVNNFREIMGFISFVYERISVTDSILIIPISKSTMTDSEWALLTKQMENLSDAMG